MPPLPLSLPTQSNQAEQPHGGIAALINCYAVPAGGSEQRAKTSIRAASGLDLVATLPGAGGARALLEVDAQHGKALLRPREEPERFDDALDEAAAVRQARERVVAERVRHPVVRARRLAQAGVVQPAHEHLSCKRQRFLNQMWTMMKSAMTSNLT
jgi:hypothetical protein